MALCVSLSSVLNPLALIVLVKRIVRYCTCDDKVRRVSEWVSEAAKLVVGKKDDKKESTLCLSSLLGR